MSHENKSTPKMRKAFTPRVKSAQSIQHHEPKRALYFTGKKQSQNKFINPQKVEQHISKKLNINVNNPPFYKKYDVAMLNTDTDSPVKRNNFLQNKQQKDEKKQNKINNKYGGRLMQWPKNDQKFKNNLNLQKVQQKNELSRQRCMSAHTIKSNYSATYSEKSKKIKDDRKAFDQKFNVAFNYLLRSNSQYLSQKLSMCNQKARPKEQIFKVKRSSINTTNKDFYPKVNDKHKLDIQPQNEKMSLLLSPSKICGNSTSQQFHNGRQGKKANLAQWNEGFKLQGPIYTATTTGNAYPHHGQFQKMVPIAVFNEHPLGMKHKQSSTNSKFFKGQFVPRADLATWNNLNPVANDLFNPKNGSHYENQHGQKERQPIQTWPMGEHKLIVTNGKFTTQFGSNIINYNSHQLNDENKCKCGRKRH